VEKGDQKHKKQKTRKKRKKRTQQNKSLKVVKLLKTAKNCKKNMGKCEKHINKTIPIKNNQRTMTKLEKIRKNDEK